MERQIRLSEATHWWVRETWSAVMVGEAYAYVVSLQYNLSIYYTTATPSQQSSRGSGVFGNLPEYTGTRSTLRSNGAFHATAGGSGKTDGRIIPIGDTRLSLSAAAMAAPRIRIDIPAPILIQVTVAVLTAALCHADVVQQL